MATHIQYGLKVHLVSAFMKDFQSLKRLATKAFIYGQQGFHSYNMRKFFSDVIFLIKEIHISIYICFI